MAAKQISFLLLGTIEWRFAKLIVVAGRRELGCKHMASEGY